MLSLLEMILHRQAKHEVILSQDGHEGLEKAFTEKPDIAIIDVMMPGMSGYDVVRQLRADPRTENIGIIMLTARGQPIDKKSALDVGADNYLTKPVQMQELIELVNALLEPKGETPAKSGLIFPVFSLRGGAGVTSIAVNLAILLQQIGGTTLLDLSPNSGHCALFLGLRPHTHWGHLLEEVETDPDKLSLAHPSGLKLLAAPPIPMQSGWFTDAQLIALLEKLKIMNRFVVIDMPPVLGPTALDLFRESFRVLLISGDDPASLQTTLATLQALQDELKRVVLIHNVIRPGPHPAVDMLQRALKTKLTASVPYDPAQSAALRKGVPLVAIQPQSGMAKALKQTIKVMLS